MIDSTSPSLPSNFSTGNLTQNVRLITLETAQGSDLQDEDGLIYASGTTDEAGKTVRVLTEKAVKLHVAWDASDLSGQKGTT
jgi:hypothetical protein